MKHIMLICSLLSGVGLYAVQYYALDYESGASTELDIRDSDTILDLSGFESYNPYQEITQLGSTPHQPPITLFDRINMNKENIDQLNVRVTRGQWALLGISASNLLLASYAIYNIWFPGD